MQRLLTIAAASVVAALILWFALTTGPVVTEDDRPTTSGPIQLPDAFDGTNAQDIGDIAPPLSDQGTIFLAEQRTWLTWATLQPEPDGMFEIEGPVARSALADGSVLEILADEGSFYAPQRQPRHGEFRGEVIINLYRPTSGKPPRYGETTDIIARAYLDQVRFDLEIGLLEATGPLHLTGPAFDFKGQGLTVRYNQLLDRLEELRIDQSQTLRLKTDWLADANTEPDASASLTPAQPISPANPQPDTQLYLLSLTNTVAARLQGDRATLRGSSLQALFSLEDAGTHSTATDTAAPTSTDGVRIERAEAPATQKSPKLADRSLCPIESTDTLITWQGPLTIEPTQALADLPTPAPGEITGRLLGADPQNPAILIAEDTRVTADSIGYNSLNQTFWAQALTESGPAILSTAQAGVLQADRLAYSLDRRTASFIGPGSWEAPPTTAFAETAIRDLTWRDELTFQLTQTPQATGQLSQLQSASASGTVGVSLDDGYLDTESFSLVRLENNEIALIASNGVSARYLPITDNADTKPATSLIAESAQILMRESADDIELLSASAEGAARLAQGNQSAQAETLAATFLPQTRNSSQPAIDRINATGSVILKDLTDDVEATGERLVIFAQRREGTLLGGRNPGDWATLRQADSRLEAVSIAGWQDQGLLAVDGPGRVVHRLPAPPASTQQTPLAPLPGLEPLETVESAPPVGPTTINLRWMEGMTYNQHAGLARAQGDVRGRFERGDETGTLAVEEVRVGLDPAGSASFDPQTSRQAIRTILASGDAEMAYARNDPDTRRTIRTTLHGPAIAYDRDAASAEILGDGWLLYEAFGTPSDQTSTTGPGVFPIDLQGAEAQRGLLLWNDLMTLDLGTQQAQADGGVELMYESSNEEPIYIDARTMLADFQGLGTQTQDLSPSLNQIRALEDVQIVRDQRLITSDGLSFDTRERIVELWGEDDNLVREANPDQPAGFAARRVRWFLDRDEVDVLEPAPVTLPVGDLERRPRRFRR